MEQEIIFLKKWTEFYNKFHNSLNKKLYMQIYKGIYIKSGIDDINEVIGRNMDDYYISDRSAITMRVENNRIYLRWPKAKEIKIWGIKIIIWEQENYYETQDIDKKLKLKRATLELSVLENFIIPKKDIQKVLSEEEITTIILKRKKDFDLEKIDLLAATNRMNTAKVRFFKIYWKIKGSKPIEDFDNYLIQYENDWLSVDEKRIKMFEHLLIKINDFQNKTLKNKKVYYEDQNWIKSYCFWEAYFSNYIEWSKFTPESALTLVENWKEYDNTKDSHNVVDSFKFIKDFYKYTNKNIIDITTFEEFKKLLILINKWIWERTIFQAGDFKTLTNENWVWYSFVLPSQLEGTLKRGFELWQRLSSNILKGLFYHFVFLHKLLNYLWLWGFHLIF